MKKVAIVVLTVCLAIFGIYLSQRNKVNVKGVEMFPDEFVESVSRIEYSPFDGSEHIIIKDDEKIEEFFEILRKEDYKILVESKWVEGFYSFEFFTKDGVKSCGIGGDTIAYEGSPKSSQYYVVSGNNLVKGIIEETVRSVERGEN